MDETGNKGDPELCEKDKTTLTIGGMKRVQHKVVSKTLSWGESKTSKGSKNNNNSGKSSSGKSISGEVYAGYVILLRAEGEIVAKTDPSEF